MGAEIQKFDAGKAVEAIRERIRAALADVIPDEQWDALIRAEVKDFLEDKRLETDRYSSGVVNGGATATAVKEKQQARQSRKS
jgi:hypothetical protein